ncbi:MAG: hypothetical protein GY948_11135 [Alphaproteobacteria bacterium]|nr:hypothetical protein [Alphaproteobacteria bacterium]
MIGPDLNPAGHLADAKRPEFHLASAGLALTRRPSSTSPLTAGWAHTAAGGCGREEPWVCNLGVL